MSRKTGRLDYSKLYPGVVISVEVMEVLKKGARKRIYQEYDIKLDKWKIDQIAQTVKCIPSREVSFDMLLDEGMEFPQEQEGVEDAAIKNLALEKMRASLDLLSYSESVLIYALFFSNGGSGMTEREYAQLSGIPQKTINNRKRKIYAKIKKFMKYQK